MKIYSKLCEYGIRALLVLSREKGKKTLVKTLCRQENLPVQFTRKALHTLLRHGYVGAMRGPTGGYFLKRAPEKITLWELVSLFDSFKTEHCLLGSAHCKKTQPCALHLLKIKSEQQWIESFQRETIAQLLHFSKLPKSHSR